MIRRQFPFAWQIACGGLFLAVLPLLAGCGSNPANEAAGADDSSRPAAESQASSEVTPSPVAPTLNVSAPPKVQAPRTADASATPAKADPVKNEAPSDDESHRKRIIGKWLQKNEEKRTITVREDGTATIIAELDDYRQYLVGKKLEFDVQWTLESGKLTFITTGGRPAESIKTITTIYGPSRVYRIIEFVEGQLMLKKDETGEDEPAWTRLPE